MEKAVIFNIMHYSIHDGPGIRTTVFFKECPLSCKWCHNPECFDPKPQQVFNYKKCILCNRCDNCPTGAIQTIGYEITVPELMKEISKDMLFYGQTRGDAAGFWLGPSDPAAGSGGVTFSGGEPLYQADFLLEILTLCRKEYINTAIDTSGYCDTETLLNAAGLADYLLYDIKFIDSGKHEQYCGAPNGLILRNLQVLAETKVKLLIRIPVIPTINDDLQEMTGIFEFIKRFKNIETVHLLPYHNIQSDKYKRLGMRYELTEIPGGESSNMKTIKSLFGTRFRTKIGG